MHHTPYTTHSIFYIERNSESLLSPLDRYLQDVSLPIAASTKVIQIEHAILCVEFKLCHRREPEMPAASDDADDADETDHFSSDEKGQLLIYYASSYQRVLCRMIGLLVSR